MKVDNKKVIEEIVELRVKKGYSSTTLVKYLKETYDLESARAYTLIKQARIKMGEIYNEVNTDALKDSILFMENMKEGALGSGDKKLALDIQKELNKVNQLYVEKVMHEIKGIEKINITIKKDRDE